MYSQNSSLDHTTKEEIERKINRSCDCNSDQAGGSWLITPGIAARETQPQGHHQRQ